MSKQAIILPWLLIIIGVLGYLGTGMASVTALIPAFFGLPLLLVIFFARKSESPKVLLIIAAVLSGLGCIGSFRGVTLLISGQFSIAVLLQVVMFIICAVFTVIIIRYLAGAR